MIPRTLAKTIESNRRHGFINLIYGPRRVGKTVLLQQLTSDISKSDVVWFNGDTSETRQTLGNTSETHLSKIVANTQTVVIDEAQRIPNIGLSLKILVDKFPQKQFFVTGSSSLALSHGLQETLTGRTLKYKLYPLSTEEITQNLAEYQKPALLEDQLRFGGYPYLQQLNKPKDKQLYLESITEDYLFRDISYLSTIKQPETIRKLASLLAFQIGSEASLSELASALGISVKTVTRYISLLKQGFVIFELGTFSRNLRKELSKSKKYYFWDLGIRNALISQFLPLDTRTDTGALWENFLAIERLKKHEYAQTLAQHYFWRTYERAEIDWIEVCEDQISAYEFKWGKSKARTPKAFREAYNTDVKVVSKENYLEFII